jgi:hypothetical protein
MDLKSIGWHGMDVMDGFQDKWVPVTKAMNLRVA